MSIVTHDNDSRSSRHHFLGTGPIDDVTAEMKSPQQVNLTERLEAVYGEVKKLIEELSGSSAKDD